MSKLTLILTLLFIVISDSFSQHVLFQSDLETIPLVFPDSLPAGWKKLDVDQNNPVMGWAVNDTNQKFGGDTTIFKPRAHSGKKSLFIFWLAGLGNTNLNDDWVWTDSLRILNGDSLIFWCLLGSTPLIAPYPDSVQIHVCTNSILYKYPAFDGKSGIQQDFAVACRCKIVVNPVKACPLIIVILREAA